MLGKFIFTNKIVAKNLGKSEEQIGRVMAFYVKEFEREMVECNHPFIFIKGLGTFGLNLKVIEAKLKIMIAQYRGHLRNREVKDYKNRDRMIETLQREIAFLFETRRKVKIRRQVNQKIRCLKNSE